MAAPAPEAEAEAEADPAPAPPAPPLPRPLSQEKYLTVTAVACSICYCVLSATFNGQQTRFACGSAEHNYQRDVPNPAPDKYLVHELKKAPQDPRHAVLLIDCPNRNITQCGGTKCTLYKISDGNGRKEFLVCHTCKNYWRAT